MTEFTFDSIFDALKSPLGVMDNPERRKQIEDYIEAARLPLERATGELCSRLAEAVGGDVAEHYDVTLAYKPDAVALEVRRREQGEREQEAFSFAEGEVEKITLRVPAELKDLATDAAAKAGLSVNSWFVRVIARAVRGSNGDEDPGQPPQGPWGGRHGGRHQGGGRRLSGWIGPA
jgi:hypothetical protein